jgi:hypothetical protein
VVTTTVIDGLPKMDPARKAEWVAALRSGQYKQGKEALRWADDNRMCCLGVVCDLHSKTPQAFEWSTGGSGQLRYDTLAAYAPDEVLMWLGIAYEDLRTSSTTQQELLDKLQLPFSQTGMVGYVLATLNDDKGYTFEQIADFIETNF